MSAIRSPGDLNVIEDIARTGAGDLLLARGGGGGGLLLLPAGFAEDGLNDGQERTVLSVPGTGVEMVDVDSGGNVLYAADETLYLLPAGWSDRYSVLNMEGAVEVLTLGADPSGLGVSAAGELLLSDPDRSELRSLAAVRTDPLKVDSDGDGDGLPDGLESGVTAGVPGSVTYGFTGTDQTATFQWTASAQLVTVPRFIADADPSTAPSQASDLTQS